MKKSFTLIELLVVITIIGILTAVAAVSYSTLTKSSRDTRRKADIEQIRAALEMYRSNYGYYPITGNVWLAPSNGGIVSSTTGFIGARPSDPISTQFYQYTANPGGPACNNTPGFFCSDYVVGAFEEVNPPGCTLAPTANCNTSPASPCNYCMGPYGQK